MVALIKEFEFFNESKTRTITHKEQIYISRVTRKVILTSLRHL